MRYYSLDQSGGPTDWPALPSQSQHSSMATTEPRLEKIMVCSGHDDDEWNQRWYDVNCVKVTHLVTYIFNYALQPAPQDIVHVTRESTVTVKSYVGLIVGPIIFLINHKFQIYHQANHLQYKWLQHPRLHIEQYECQELSISDIPSDIRHPIPYPVN